jgi:hypothetical protein
MPAARISLLAVDRRNSRRERRMGFPTTSWVTLRCRARRQGFGNVLSAVVMLRSHLTRAPGCAQDPLGFRRQSLRSFNINGKPGASGCMPCVSANELPETGWARCNHQAFAGFTVGNMRSYSPVTYDQRVHVSRSAFRAGRLPVRKSFWQRSQCGLV